MSGGDVAPQGVFATSVSHWDPGQTLREITLDGLRWVQARKERFQLPEDVVGPHTDLNWTMKPLGELAQLTASICRHSDFGEERRRVAAELLEFAWRETRSGMLLLELFQAEPNSIYPLEIYAAFADMGLRNPRFEEFAEVVVRTRSWRQTEQDPTRRLGLRNAERRSGLRPQSSVATLLRRTWLGGLPEPWTFERGVGYDLTHTIFHLTDWGNAPRLVPSELDIYLQQWLPAWLDTCLDGEQWDLSCELLAVGASLPTPYPSCSHEPAWWRIAQARGADGALREEGAVAQDPDEATAFARCYHSTLAAAFAAVLTLERHAAAHIQRPAETEQWRPEGEASQNGRTPDTAPQAGASR